MKSTLGIAVALILTAEISMSQPWTATHARDTSSFFPVGVFNMYMARSAPPFLPITGVFGYNEIHSTPIPDDIDAWVERDTVLKSLNVNYVAGHIPRYYFDKWTRMPETFEQIHYKQLMDRLDIRMDLSQSLYWMEGARLNGASGPVLTDSSVRGAVRSVIYRSSNYPDTPNPLRHPCYPPGYNLGSEALNAELQSDWDVWHTYVDSKLLEIHNDSANSDRWLTFYLGEEADLFGFDCEYPLDWTRRSAEYIDSRFHAVQYALHAWDSIHPDPRMKPLLITGSYEGNAWGLVKRIRAELLNARMVAMFAYPFTAPLPGYPDSLQRTTTYTGQRFAIDAFRMRMDNFRNEFQSRGDIELWWIPQAFKQVDLYPDDWHYSAHRYPTYDELRIQASLALSHGMKGILWYLYGSGEDSLSASSGVYPSEWPFGVVDGLTRAPIHHDKEPALERFAQPHPWRDCTDRNIDPFGDLARVNAELNEIGPFFRKLELVDVFDQSTIPSNCLGLTKVEAAGKYGDEAIDISVFRRYDCDTCWYVALVNKILNDTEDPCFIADKKSVQIHFNRGRECTLIRLPDGFEVQPLPGSPSGKQVFETVIAPGQIQLFEIKNADCRVFFLPEPIPDRISVRIFPNPAYFTASFEYTLPESGAVKLKIYTALGALAETLVDRTQEAGTHEAVFGPARMAPSGVYYYELRCGDRVEYGHFIIIR